MAQTSFLRCFAFAFACSLAACASSEGSLASTSTSTAITEPACDAPRSAQVALIVAPDDGDARVIALLDAAATSIDVTIYELSSQSIVGALHRAADRGVRVRVIQDHNHIVDGVATELRGAGVELRPSAEGFVNTHQKTIVVDRRSLFLFSGNFDKKSFVHARNYGVVDEDAADVADVEELFEADWDARSPNLACTRLAVSPIDSRSKVLDFIASATTTLDVEALYITDRSVQRALEAARARGVAVRVLFNDPSHHMVDETVLAGRLAAEGIAVRRSGELFVHAKLLVVDGTRAFIGSENFSPTSLDKNREAGVFLSAAEADLSRITTAFNTDWSNSLPFDPPPPPAPPPPSDPAPPSDPVPPPPAP